MILDAHRAWIWYLAGAFLTLAWKFVRYLRHENQNGVSRKEATLTWVFEDSTENTVSWVTTIGIVWCFGAVFIDLRESEGIFSFAKQIPMHKAIAFLFGGLMEIAAPTAAKNVVAWVISKLPGGGSS